MTQDVQTVSLVAAASFCFTSASLVFTVYSKKISANWMNATKAFVCLFCTAVVAGPLGWLTWPSMMMMLGLFASGALGLGLGDYFMLEAFVKIGSARTILLYSFQPVFLGLAGWFLFHQEVTLRQCVAIVFLMGCLVSFALEKRKESGGWHLEGLVFALLAVLFDNGGVMLTRWSFSQGSDVHPIWANFFRCVGALSFFAILNFFRPFHWIKNFTSLVLKDKVLVVGSGLVGTMFSLGFYIAALKQGHLAMIGALGGLAPLMSAVLESLFLKKWPSRYFVTAFLLFSVGLGIFLGFDRYLSIFSR